jgi:2,3-bisphosphoglycerate-independent phosphoglycerate mutase
MDIFMVPEATGSKNTSLKAKALAVKKALSQGYTFVLLHIKATDSFSHDGDLKGKTAFIEKIDREIIPTLMKTGAYLIVTGDHSTPCSRKNHSAHEVPIIIYGKDERKDKVSKFDELSCMDGGLGHIEGKDVMRLMLNLLEKSLKFGS